MAYGITPVQWALHDIGNTLQQGMGNMGQHDIKMEQLGLQRALQEHNLGRQREMDTLTRPGLEVAAEENKQKLTQMNEPVTLQSLGINNEASMAHWMNPPTGGGDTLLQKATGLLGAKYDTDPESPTRGSFLKSDGTLLTNKDIAPKSNELAELIISNTDPIYLADGQKMQAQLDRAKLIKQGVKGNDPRLVELDKKMAGIDKVLKDPEAKVKLLKRQRDMVSKFSGEDAKKNVARMDAEITKLEGTMAKTAEENRKYAWEREKLGIQETGKTARAQKSAEAKERAAKIIHGGKAVKLSPQDTEKAKVIQNEIKSNLAVIQAFNKGDVEATATQAALATRRNIGLKKQLEKLGAKSEKAEADKQNFDPLGLFEDEEEEE